MHTLITYAMTINGESYPGHCTLESKPHVEKRKEKELIYDHFMKNKFVYDSVTDKESHELELIVYDNGTTIKDIETRLITTDQLNMLKELGIDNPIVEGVE